MIILKPAGDDVACAKKKRGCVSPYNVLGKFSSIILSSGVSMCNSRDYPGGYAVKLYRELGRGSEVCATGLSDRRLKIAGLSPLIRTPNEGTSI